MSPRADAARNRELLVETARQAFAASDEAVSLEAIARSAGVGIGTLYRHFPTREALVEVVYAAELDEVTAFADEVLDHEAPEIALRSWMVRYSEFVVTKRGMLDTLRGGWAAGTITTPRTRERISGAISRILTAGVSTGVFRSDVLADDVTSMLLGIFLSRGHAPEPHALGRMLDLLVAGVRA